MFLFEEVEWNIFGTDGRVLLKWILIEIFHERVVDTELIQVGLSGGLWSKRQCSVSDRYVLKSCALNRFNSNSTKVGNKNGIFFSPDSRKLSVNEAYRIYTTFRPPSG